MPQTISKIYKTLVFDDAVSLAVLDTTALVNEAIRRHQLSPVAAAALGRTLTATAYLASWLKDGESSLSVSVNGGGAGGKIGAAADGALNVRGFIEHPDVMLPPRADGKLDVGSCVGKRGTLTVIRDDGAGIPFVGTSELVSGEIAEDFSAYFLTSEQRPTAIALGVKIAPDGVCAGAGGVILQPLPRSGYCAISARRTPTCATCCSAATARASGRRPPFLRWGGRKRRAFCAKRERSPSTATTATPIIRFTKRT